MLVVALAVTLVLGILGVGVEGKLRPTSVDVPGTESARGAELLERAFGDSAPFVVLLRGPAPALDRQGPRLIRDLRRDPRVTTLSPWDRGTIDRLRPSPRRALVLVDFHVDSETATDEAVPALNSALERAVRPPVSATQSGYATLSRALQEESVHSTRVAELIAVPFLLLVLLLVFRSPVAAVIPLLFGGVAVLVTRGILSLAADHLAIDGFALTVASMMGLALGVDYTLLMVSRFREELAQGAEPLRAASLTRRTAGRTTVFAGSTLLLAMALILWLMPGTLFLSLAGTAFLVTAISVAIAFFVAPPLLGLLGPNVDRWRIGKQSDRSRLSALVAFVLRRPGPAALVTGLALVLLALPALALKTGPPSVEQLPASSSARENAEAIDEEVGPGWDAPFTVVAVSGDGPITVDEDLGALHRAQRRIATDPGVQAVVGPGSIRRRLAPLRRAGNELLAERGEADPARLDRLGSRLGEAADGVGRVRRGLGEAALGAGLLATGSDRAGEGAARLSSGLHRVAEGADEAIGGLNRLDQGSKRLAAGQRQAALASRSLRDELNALLPVLRQGGVGAARRLRAELQRAARSDPSLAAAARRAELLVERLVILRNQAKRAKAMASRLHAGQGRLAEGSARLHSGAAELAAGAERLPQGLDRLAGGASRLAGGLGSLTGGADALSRNLAEGATRTAPLQTGLTRASVRVMGDAADLRQQVGSLRRSSPQIFDSGYFFLSALDGAPPERRERVGRVIDLDRGGQAAQLLVIPRYTFNTDGSRALKERLESEASSLGRTAALETAVTGGPAQLVDYDEAVSSRVPLVVLAISIATFLVLVLVLRALPLAAIAVALNLLTVAVAFGVLTLLFEVPDGWPLGGRTYVDAIGAAGIFGIIFGLSIDYAVFLLGRMRESFDSGASNAEAVAFGLERTARVITGAAAIMLAVFVAFAGAPVATVSQLGVGLTVAVVLDATVVRLVLLPALMLLLGERVWWLPSSLSRLLPKPALPRG